jgi:cytochrome c oxidase subunit 2
MNFVRPLLRTIAQSAVAAACAGYSLGSWAAVGDSEGGPRVNQLNLPEGVTQISREIYDLHNGMMLLCLVIFVGVFSAMFYSVIVHRKSRGYKAATWHESTTVEIIWTIVPFIIVILMALPATKTVIAMKDTTNSDITIKATGSQWKWGYDYLKGEGEGISFLSNLATPRSEIGDPELGEKANPTSNEYLLDVDHPVVVPVNKKIRIITTANDVIHAWAIPQFGVKQDAIPGFVRDTWFKAEVPGVYRGECQELCGKEHAYMPIVVRVVSADDYTKWVAAQKQLAVATGDDTKKTWSLPELMARGEQVYGNCVSCHQANGQGVAGSFPSLAGDPVVTGPKQEQIHVVLDGKNNKMPSWKQLSDVELAAVITYTRNKWGNHPGEMVQPSDIKAARS